jgi:perosamine synthetase
MIMTSRPNFAERMRRLREHAMTVSAADRHASIEPVIEEYPETGFNYRMSDMQAAVGIVQLTRLDAMTARRRDLAHYYQERLAGITGLRIVTDTPLGRTNFQSFWIVLPDDFPLTRDNLLRKMMKRGISARRGFMAAHLEPAYRDSRHGELAVTERLTRQSLILPLFHEITQDQQDQVIAVVRESAGLPTPRAGRKR